jgi:hypothetical protein
MFDDEFFQPGQIPIFNGLNHLSMLNDGLLNPMRKGPGIKSDNMSFCTEVINHVIKVTIPAAPEDHSMKFGIHLNHLVCLFTEMSFHFLGDFFQVLDLFLGDML